MDRIKSSLSSMLAVAAISMAGMNVVPPPRRTLSPEQREKLHQEWQRRFNNPEIKAHNALVDAKKRAKKEAKLTRKNKR